MTRQETAYRHVRRQLVDGRWREGQMLSPAKVAKEIGVSYTPMREAMIQLATEGILEQAPQGRMYVKTFSRNDMHELFEFRRTLEGGAAELAAEKLTPQQLSDLRACLQEHRKHLGRLIRQTSSDDTEDILNDLRRVDIQFHLSVIAAGGNPKITKLVNDMHLLTRIFERRIPQAVESSHKLACRIYAYHRRVLKALDARDGEEARKWMARHLRWGQQYHLALLDKQEQKKMASHIEESFLG